MNPRVGRVAFGLAFYFTLMSLAIMFLLPPDSPALVANTLALIFSIAFLLVVAWDVRRQVKVR